ncbi:ABC transporter permease [Thermohalobacter berrensis]|uniref:Tungstate transporter permease n=1 Tax=Thermohalobacter berrensis TaxID=99594 RepID=A0A419T2H6_9FIRM|nr:ABC transporter permease [Thermohalobacter berrensis]RKD31643.1 tungstate transporter permease [Thermohalobacter berrensis]
MDYIINGIIEALKLLVSFNRELYEIIFLSVFVSSTATLISSIIFIPLGLYLGIKNFKGKKLFSRLLYTLMSIPSVVVGLLVAILLSRRGPLGFLELLYTPTAMIIAQSLLVTPLSLGLSYNLSKNRGKKIERVGITLGARGVKIIFLLIRELKIDLFINLVTVFSRAISEVGAVMIVGGNIKNRTRVITTSIAMFNSMGNYSTAIALGLVLLAISFIINSLIYSYHQEDY